ncbi:MAG: biopolymer transporter ExbD [Candidatus Gastranaerophilales bacterium]|nr:biopolymer transporter ExbD [Candidatus Gastranaerophilales bacterium]
MATTKRKRRKTFNEINITPLTDIFLVLLIIMMVVAPMLDQQGLSLAVPSAQEVKEEIKENKIITVDVSQAGEYFIDEEAIKEPELIKILKENSKEKEGGLLIRANENATHGAVVKLMDMARTAGVFSISLVEE